MVPLHKNIVVKIFGNMSSGIQHYWSIYSILTNNAQELTPYRFEFKSDTNRIRKYFPSMPKFEPGSLLRVTKVLANSATLPLFRKHCLQKPQLLVCTVNCPHA